MAIGNCGSLVLNLKKLKRINTCVYFIFHNAGFGKQNIEIDLQHS